MVARDNLHNCILPCVHVYEINIVLSVLFLLEAFTWLQRTHANKRRYRKILRQQRFHEDKDSNAAEVEKVRVNLLQHVHVTTSCSHGVPN